MMPKKKLSSFLRQAGVDSLLLVNGRAEKLLDPNFTYFAEGTVDSSALIAKKGKLEIFTPEMNLRLAKSLGIRAKSYHAKKFISDISATLAKSKKIGINGNSLGAGLYLQLKRKLGGRMVDVSEKLLELRARKERKEISLLKKSCKICNDILDEIEVKKGKTELRLASELKIAALEKNSGISFEPIVASGKNASFPHWRPSKKKLSGVVLVDFGIKYMGYCSDFTRCYFLGECKKEKQKYEILESIFWEIADNIPEFGTSRELSSFSKSLFRKNKLPPPPHSIGHGIGLEVHEYPSLHEKSEHALGEGMAMAIEPAYYGSRYGLRFEKDLLIGKTKARLL